MDAYGSVPGAAPREDMHTLLDRLLTEAEAESPSPAPSGPEQQGESQGNPPPDPRKAVPPASLGAGQLLGGLLANPSLLSALPGLMEAFSGLAGGGGATAAVSASPPAAVPTVGNPVVAPKLPTAPAHHSIDRHTALLCAVKPYLGAERQATAETILRLCKIWDTLQRAGISLPTLLSSLGVAGRAGVGESGSSPPSDHEEVT